MYVIRLAIFIIFIYLFIIIIIIIIIIINFMISEARDDLNITQEGLL